LVDKYDECCRQLKADCDAKRLQLLTLADQVCCNRVRATSNTQLHHIEQNIDSVKRNKARAERELRSRTDDIVARLDAAATRQYLALLGVCEVAPSCSHVPYRSQTAHECAH
jgi:hypothetical protein